MIFLFQQKWKRTYGTSREYFFTPQWKSSAVFFGNKIDFIEKKGISFLPLIFGKDGIRVDSRKVDKITSWPKPKTFTGVRSFPGLIQFLRVFIKNHFGVAALLTNLTKDQSIQKWYSSWDKAFEVLNESINTAPILIPPDSREPFLVHLDASQFTVVRTLTQLD